MKKIILIIVGVLISRCVFSQTSILPEIKTFSYWINNQERCFLELKIQNHTQDSLLLWVADNDILGKSSEKRIGEFFFESKTKNGWTLSEMIYDGNSTQIPIVIGETFLTEIGEGEEFKIIIIDASEIDETAVWDFYKHYVSVISLQEIKRFGFEEMMNWKGLLYKSNYIFLDTSFFRHNVPEN